MLLDFNFYPQIVFFEITFCQKKQFRINRLYKFDTLVKIKTSSNK